MTINAVQLSVAGLLFAKMSHQTSRENKKCFLLERAQPMPRRPLLGKIEENLLSNKPRRIRDKRFKNTENITIEMDMNYTHKIEFQSGCRN
jgi:hypothetical protein